MDYQPLLVPLIPADLLPEYVELEGVSRYLTLAEIRGMTSVGTMDLAGEKYHVKFNLSGDPVLNDSWGSINDVKGADETGPAGNLKSTFSDIRQNSTQEFGQFQPNSNEVRRSGILQDTSLSSIASSGGCLRSSCQNVATGSPSSEPAPGFLTDQTIDHIRSGSAAKASHVATMIRAWLISATVWPPRTTCEGVRFRKRGNGITFCGVSGYELLSMKLRSRHITANGLRTNRGRTFISFSSPCKYHALDQ